MKDKIRVAFVKFGGLSAGGTERWLQMMAANLPQEQFEVDYFYCDSAPYVSSDFKHPDTDLARLRYMQETGVNLIKFHVGAKDITAPTHDWIDTDFWNYFDHGQYDFVQTAKAGPPEYPYYLMSTPVVECVTLSAGIDTSPNLAWSFHISQWQRRGWGLAGGNVAKSSIVPIPVLPPATDKNLRDELGISPDALVCGFHQRDDNAIFSSVPLDAFSRIANPEWHFIIMGGGERYLKQAAELGLANVHFIGHAGDSVRISAFLNSLDIFAHGRRDGETFGTVLAEAMIHGVPCLSHSSLVGNNNAQLETMGPGGMFAYNVGEYTGMLDELFANEKLRNKLSVKAKEHAEQYYSLSACTKKVVETYMELAGLPGEKKNGPVALDYGYSPLGYLQAGDLENRASIANHILVGGIPEQFEVELVRQFLLQAKTFIDVGANIGLYCLVAAKEIGPTGKIVAYEPQPDCCDVLKHTVNLNNWEERFWVQPVALGAASSVNPLYLAGSGSTLDDDFNDNHSTQSILVDVDTLDNQILQLGLDRVDFIKIDVEGVELQVLQGAEKTIKEQTPVIFVEIADRIRGRNYKNKNYQPTLRWLQAHGYVIYKCTEDFRLKEVGLKSQSDHLAMYLCLHQPTHKHWKRKIKTWALKYAFAKKYLSLLERYTYYARRLVQIAIYYLGRAFRAILHPKKTLKHIGNLIFRIIGHRAKSAAAETAFSSYERHQCDYKEYSLETIKNIYCKFETENNFNHPENRFADLLARYPENRFAAIDIGCGAGWLSAHLHREGFARVIGIEPSSTALSFARQLYPHNGFPSIQWIEGFAENVLSQIEFAEPVLFVTGCVLAHLPDDVVIQICKRVAQAPAESLLAFSEPWGPKSDEPLWHVRTPAWWQHQLSGWDLIFHGPAIQNVPGRHKGFHGIKRS